jgi:hypothetical protein
MKILNWKQSLHWGGLLIGISGVLFVALKLWDYSGQISFSGMSWPSVIILVLLVIVYGCANLLLSFSWRNILLHLSVDTTRGWALQTYGISQIAKYVPGNIFQFVGRQAMGQAADVKALPLVKSSMWEIGLIAVTGSFFAILVIPEIWPPLSYSQAIVLLLVLLVSCISLLFRWPGKGIAMAMMGYALFLMISGIIFTGVLMAITAIPVEMNEHLTGIIGVYIISWLAGLITPGAPAGIGVREMVFLTIFPQVIPETEMLKAIVIGRFITVGGDMLFYLLAMTLRSTSKQPVSEKSPHPQQ